MTILTSLIGPVTGLLDKFIEDKDKKNAIAFELSTMAEKHAQELAKGQLAVNQTEAAHKVCLWPDGDLRLAGYVALRCCTLQLLVLFLVYGLRFLR